MKNILSKICATSIFILMAYCNIFSQADACDVSTEMPIITVEVDPSNPDPFEPEFDPDPPIEPEEEIWRGVFWTHGIGGNDYSMSKAISISSQRVLHSQQSSVPGADPVFVNNTVGFPARRMRTATPSFAAGETLFSIGDRIGQHVHNTSKTTWNQTLEQAKIENYCISHSMGGLGMRRAESMASVNQGFRAGGMVTFATPHAGALLAKNIYKEDPTTPVQFEEFENEGGFSRATEKFANFLNEAGQSLSAGPEAEFIASNFLLERFANGLIMDLVDGFISAFTSVAPALASGGFFSRSILNLQPGDVELEAVYNSSHGTVNVPFYGAESKDQTLWRLAFWGMNSPNSVHASMRTYDGDGHFDAGNDELALKSLNNNIAEYQAKALVAKKDIERYQEGVDDFCPWQIIKCDMYVTDRNSARNRWYGWTTGVSWWKNSTVKWDLLTGARSYTTRKACFCFENGDEVQVICPGPSNQECWEEDIHVEIFKKSCGVVLKESAVDFNGSVFQDQNGNPTGLELTGSNHFQMRNDQSLKGALLTLYDAAFPELEFFLTQKQVF